MMVCSTVSPQIVSLVKLENNIATYKLRQNITESLVINEFQNLSDTIYQYDELTLQVTYVENIEQLISGNFTTYWNLATEQLNTKKLIDDKKRQMINLIDNGNYQLITVNEQTKDDLNTLILGLMDAYEQILTLSAT